MVAQKRDTKSDEWCGEHLNCNMLRKFLQHKDVSQQQTLKLEVHIAHLMHNLHQVSISNQNGQLVMNILQIKMDELQTAYTVSKVNQAWHEIELQEEWLEHWGTQKCLTHKINSHADTQKTLKCCWETLKKLGDFCDYVTDLLNSKPANKNMKKQTNIADLMLKIEFRKQTMNDMMKEIELKEEKWKINITALKQKLHDQTAKHEDTVQKNDL